MNTGTNTGDVHAIAVSAGDYAMHRGYNDVEARDSEMDTSDNEVRTDGSEGQAD